jgi:hypothetical protein
MIAKGPLLVFDTGLVLGAAIFYSIQLLLAFDQ